MMQKTPPRSSRFARNPLQPTMRSMVGQRGFSLFSAIFLLVMLSALGAAIVKVTSSSQIASALDIQGERAYQAARAGVEWGLYRQRREGSCPPDGTSFALPSGTATRSTLAGFTVTVKCDVKFTPEAGDGIKDGQVARASPLNPDGRTLMPFAGTLVAGVAAVSDVADTSMLAEGMIVRGKGIADRTRISSVTSSTTLTLTNPVTLGGVQSLTYQSSLDTYTLKSTACNQPNASGACPHDPTSNHPDYVQRVLEVRF